jgi:transcription antitermination factor NusG
MIDPKKKGKMNITAIIGQPSTAAQQKGLKNGALVGIVSGPYDGLYAKITQLGGVKSLVKIVGQTDEMIISHEDLTVVDPRKLGKDHPALQKEDDTHNDRHNDKHSSSSRHKDDDAKHKDKKRRTDDYEYGKDKSSSKSDRRDSDKHDSKHSDKNGSDGKHKSSSSSSSSAPAANWITTEIRVKINSKSYRDGKYYGMKGRVLNLLPGNKCSVVLEEYDRVLDDVEPKYIETVMPANGGVVKVLLGPHKGFTGTLMERDNSKGTVQVQLHEDLSIQVLSMDDVAQYFGHVDV